MSDWHLRKEVTVGNIVAILLAVVALISAWHNLDTRLSLVEASVIEEKYDRERDVERICNKLDRIENILLER